MRRSITALLAICLFVFTTGCFEIEQNIDLQKDMSGTATFKIGIDFEPMVLIMAQIGREMEGKKGPPTQAELDKAKAEFKKSSKNESASAKAEATDKERKEMEKELPKGVKLLDFKITEKEFGMVSDFKFGFDDLKSLVGVKLSSSKDKKEGEPADPTKKSGFDVIDAPFQGLEILEKGNTLTLQMKPVNPQDKVEEETKGGGAKPDPETEKMMADAFKNLRVAYKITAPFKIVSHNATRKEGNTLVWEYTLKEFEKMEKAGKLDVGVKVVYKK